MRGAKSFSCPLLSTILLIRPIGIIRERHKRLLSTGRFWKMRWPKGGSYHFRPSGGPSMIPNGKNIPFSTFLSRNSNHEAVGVDCPRHADQLLSRYIGGS